MNYNQLIYFSTLAQEEHYTKAAEILEISQPSLSRAISNLEEELGIFLFQKQGRNVKLTRYGKIYLAYVNRALKELKNGEEKMHKFSDIESGTIRIGCISSAVPFIGDLISSYLKDHTNISFVFEQGTTQKLLGGLKNERYDMVFCPNMNDEMIQFLPFKEEKLVAIVYKDHPLYSKNEVTIEEIAKYPLISYEDSVGAKHFIDEIFQKKHLNPTIFCKVSEDLALANLICNKTGIAIVVDDPIFSVFPLKRLELVQTDYTRFICLATIKNNFLADSVQAFKQFVINHVDNSIYQ